MISGDGLLWRKRFVGSQDKQMGLWHLGCL